MNSKLIQLLFSLLILQQVSVYSQDKVQLDFYIESLCPFTQSLFADTGSFKQAFDIPDFDKICEYNIYPFGNAILKKTDERFFLSCQHGPQECYGNSMQQCALKHLEKHTAVEFIQCLENMGTPQFDNAATQCSSLHPDIDLNQIYACIDNPMESQQLQVDYSLLSKKVQYTPYITVNGKHNKDFEDQIISNMVKFVCEQYTGDEVIDACSDDDILDSKHFTVKKFLENHVQKSQN